MKVIYNILFSAALFFSCTNETTLEKPVEVNNEILNDESAEEEITSENCVLNNDSIVPFSFEEKLEKVQIVTYSYNRLELTSSGPGSDPTESRRIEKNGKIDFNAFDEKVILDSSQVRKLKELIQLYKPKGALMQADCYNPHHCIHFLDGEENLLGYIEICLMCQNGEFSSEELRITCDSHFNMFEKFMKDCGIKKRLLLLRD